MELEFGVSAGIQLKALAGGMVPLHEEHESRLERGFSLTEWYAMDVDERALVIAIRRNHIQIQNLQSEAEIRKNNREAKKAHRK